MREVALTFLSSIGQDPHWDSIHNILAKKVWRIRLELLVDVSLYLSVDYILK